MYQYLETCGWVALFILILCCVHVQFKYCVPVGLWVLKFLEAFWILVLIRLYVMYRIYERTFNLVDFYNDAWVLANTTYTLYKEKFEL